MKTIRVFGIPFALLLLLVLAVAPAYAQGGAPCITSASTSTNVMGMNNWQTLCGQSAVYSFYYDGAGDPVLLQMSANPQNSANFFVYTASEFQKGVNQGHPANYGGNEDNGANTALGTPIGEGTRLTSKDSNGDTIFLNNGNLMWRGDSAQPGTYFVLVQPTSGETSSFWIDASGSGVSGFHYVASSMPAQAAPQLAMATTGTSAGTSPVPAFLPRTGGEFEAVQLLAAGAALVSAGLFLRRRK